MTLRLLDTFSGIGGFSLAARWLGGFETIQFVEVDPFCRRILRQHWPGVPIHQDICNFRPKAGFADVIVGGFPCQDISIAGKQRGIKEGTRSGLFYELMRVVRSAEPRYIVLENVSAIVSGGLELVLREIASAGFDAEWACIKASDVGACHQRNRWWLVGTRSDAGGCRPITFVGNAVADTSGVHGERWREAGYMASQAGARESEAGKRQWNGHAPVDSSPTLADTVRKQRKRSRSQGKCQSDPQRAQWQPVRSHQGPALSPDWRTYASEPVLRRGNDGLSGRVDRLKALGNAVVPHAAMIPLARVLELERQRKEQVRP